jgi:hypothetical protein
MSWLNLRDWIPQRDVRKLIYRLLTPEDKLVVEWAHGFKGARKTPKPDLAFGWYCAKHGYLELLKWASNIGCEDDGDTYYYAARNGHLDVLNWLREKGSPFNSSLTAAYAALGGHLHVLKWVQDNQDDWAPFDKWTAVYAASGGHLEVLKWALANGCPWDSLICSNAAKNGHVEVLKWAQFNGCNGGCNIHKDLWKIKNNELA